jgi:acyl transferase domain-containing protein
MILLPDEAPVLIHVIDELCKPATESKIHTAELSQPICTAIQIALVETLRLWKIEPDAVLGHSSGEIAAAYTCGAISMASALAIACFRGATAHASRRKGGMAAIGLGREALLGFLEPGVVIACENSQSSSTLSGDLQQVEKVVGKIKEECPDVLARMLKVEKAYHSRK